MNTNVLLPNVDFGKRNGLNYRRSHDCIILQPSEMIVIDYPDVKNISVSQQQQQQQSPRRVSDVAQLRKSVHSMNLDSVPVSHNAFAHMLPSCSRMDGIPTFVQPPSPPTPPLPPQHMRKPYVKIAPLPSPPSTGLTHTSRCDTQPSCSLQVAADECDRATNTSNLKSQVFLNGLSAGDDTLVRVKHRTRKSNSVCGNPIEGRPRLPSLPEGVVDSEEEDDESCPSHDSFHELRDSVRECLEKEPSERNSDDVSVLLEFMQHMSALASLPVSIRRELCLKMVFAVVADAGTVVLQHKEKLDAWSIIVNGQVEVVKPNGERIEYKLGDSFGAQPIPVVQYHDGEMRTLVDDCEFVLVEHRDYCSIMSTVSEHIERHSDGVTGEIVSETERRTVGNQVGQVLIKANKDKLIEHLIEDREVSVDQHYIEDFLLMYRVFISDPTMIFEKLMHWFAEAHLRDKVARIVLLWANNHFNDFESNGEMLKLLERFEQALERDQMHSQQALLNIACSVKSRPRTITYTRSNRDQPLSLSILGGQENSYSGIFVSDVHHGSQADKIGLKRGDQILEVNGQSFKTISLPRAIELLRESTHLSMTVKSNLLGFKEMIAQPERGVDVDTTPQTVHGSSGRFTKHKGNQRNTINAITVGVMNNGGKGNSSQSICVRNRSSRSTIGKTSVMDKFLTMLKGSPNAPSLISLTSDQVENSRTNALRASRSNPDIAGQSITLTSHGPPPNISQYYQPVKSQCPEHVLKVFRADQSFKYLTVYRETTAQNVVQLALQEFGMTSEGGSLEWALCEATVTPEGVIRQKRLPDQLTNLAERIGLNSRYYLKNKTKSETLVTDAISHEVLKEAETLLSHLNAQILAAQLTLQDFAVFSSIEQTEYVDNLFNLESRYGWPKLAEFELLFNKEMWWVATEICRERSVPKRAKLVKKFIKIARYCRDFRNFNSMFAIMSGLDKPAVRRLHHTWERVPSKYIKMFEDVQQLVDPSRNMSKYRQHLAIVSQEPPVVPMYPVLKKDLTFSHEGNPTYCDKLINFEKLRMIANAIRSVTKLCSAPYEIGAMAQQLEVHFLLIECFELFAFLFFLLSSETELSFQSNSGSVNDALLHMNSFDGANGAVATMRKVGPNGMKNAAQPRKKTYEQALMVRKVKAYLSNLDVIESEVELDRLSYECEPSTGSATGTRKRVPSPSPSSLSSQSSISEQRKLTTPKFGVESPQAMQKILSLVQTSRIKPQSGSVISPAQSPSMLPRGIRSRNAATTVQRVPSINYRSNSTTAEIQPVELNPESSSVTNLYSAPVRLSSTGLNAIVFT
uniref:Rap guanine nucleotide exchange factor 2 n=1 Tax=Syphacia muris TaxID=451379 RepID=A0A0N5AB86_9BILA